MDDTATDATDQLRDGNRQAEQAIRRLHDEWFAASAAKDLDRSMAPIAASIVSYEHSSPLQIDGIALNREEFRRGCELTGDDFRWLMIHQRVSFPIDPTTGHAPTELTP